MILNQNEFSFMFDFMTERKRLLAFSCLLCPPPAIIPRKGPLACWPTPADSQIKACCSHCHSEQTVVDSIDADWSIYFCEKQIFLRKINIFFREANILRDNDAIHRICEPASISLPKGGIKPIFVRFRKTFLF